MGKIVDIVPSSYYDWTKCDMSTQQAHYNRCELFMKATATHTETTEEYGYERLHTYFNEQGHKISKYMARSLKEDHEIKCRYHKRFKVTTDSDQNKYVYPNLICLNRSLALIILIVALGLLL